MWTTERVRRLTELWGAGHSASVIAADMGDVTRNAVIGKANRLGLAARRTKVASVRRPRLPRPPRERLPRVHAPRLPRFKPNRFEPRCSRPRGPEMTKAEINAMIAEAFRNTAALPVK